MTVDLALSIVGAASEALVDGWESYVRVVECLLSVIIGGDLIVWNAIDITTGNFELHGSESDTWRWLLPALEQTAADNPLLLHFVRASSLVGPIRMGDVAPDVRAFRRGRLYNELWRPMGARFQIGLPTISAATGISRGWAINRSNRDFTNHDLSLLAGLQRSFAALEDLSAPTRIVERPHSAQFVTVQDARRRAEPNGSGRDPRLTYVPNRNTTMTPREQEVLQLVAAGCTAVHIAHKLRLSVGTVRKHLEHIYIKLDAHDRLLAVQKARTLGLLPG